MTQSVKHLSLTFLDLFQRCLYPLPHLMLSALDNLWNRYILCLACVYKAFLCVPAFLPNSGWKGREWLAFWIKMEKVSLRVLFLCTLPMSWQTTKKPSHFLFSFLSLYLLPFTFPYEPNSVGVEWGEFKWNALKLISHSLSFMPIYFVNVRKMQMELELCFWLLRMITVPTSSTIYALFVGFRGSRSSGRNSCLHFAPTIQHHG